MSNRFSVSSALRVMLLVAAGGLVSCGNGSTAEGTQPAGGACKTDADCADVKVAVDQEPVCSVDDDPTTTGFCTIGCNPSTKGQCATTVGAAGPVCKLDTGNVNGGFCADGP